MDMDQCRRCQSTGLALMPVRYAVVPPQVDAGVPDVLQCERVAGVSLDAKHAKYALRVLRQGFYYVFYEQGPDGENYWESYSVDPKGQLWHMPFPEMVRVMEKEGSCSRKFHLPMVTQFITIRSPEKCGTVWLAFSGHKWSPETIEYYEDVENRKNRFQSFEPSQWINGNEQQRHAARVYDVLSDVVEYNEAADASLLPSYQNVGTFSLVKPPPSKDGGRSFSYNKDLLNKVGTRYPLVVRRSKRQIANTYDVMQSRSFDSSRMRHFTPVVFAMWDAVGCAHELNGYRNEPMGRYQQFAQELELELQALAGVDGAKLQLEQQAIAEAINETRILHTKWREVFEREQRAGKWDHINYNVNVVFSDHADNPESLNDDLLEIEEIPDDWKARHNKAAAQGKAEFETDTWPEYEEYLDLPTVDSLRLSNAELMARVDEITDARTVEVIKWLEAPLLIDTLRDFNDQNIVDGLLFEDVVSDAILAIGSSPSGRKKLDEWVAELKASIDTNLVWRTMALNQKEAKKDLDTALATAYADRTELSDSAMALFIANTKTLQRFADSYKRADGIHSLNASSFHVDGLHAFGARIGNVDTKGIDRFMITAGDAIASFFRIDAAADYIGEKILQHIFLVRAFVDPIDSIRLVAAQAKAQNLTYKDTLRRINTAKEFLSEEFRISRSDQAASLQEAWEKVKSDAWASQDGIAKQRKLTPQIIRDARLPIVVGLVECGNLLKLLSSDEVTTKTASYIVASSLTIMAAMTELAYAPAKKIWEAESATHQRLRFFGGVLGGFASLIGSLISAHDVNTSVRKDRWILVGLYALKTGALGLAGIVTVMSMFTYSAGLIAKLTGKASLVQGARFAGGAAGRLIGGRIILAVSGWLFTIGLIALDILIQWISPNAMQEWFDTCALGKHPDDEWDVDSQQKAFEEAVAEVL